MASPEFDSRQVLDRSVGENLDRLITMDMRGDEICRVIYRASRALTSEPLSVAGGRFLLDKLSAGGTALFITGFRIPPAGMPETDGLIGSAVLAFALVKARAAVPVCVCEPEVIPALAAAVRATGLAVADSVKLARELPLTAAIVPFRKDECDPEARSAQLATEIDPGVCVAIERAGRNAKGEYHFAGGKNVTEAIASIDSLFVAVSRHGVPTLAVGDFGNELGMGAIADVVKTETPAGGNCGCGCGGGTACEIPADLTVACAVSDWGAYALSAAISHLTSDPSAFVTADVYRRVIEATVAAGAVDGTSRLAIPHIDGISDDFNSQLVEQLRSVVAYPNRPNMDNALRQYRAMREGYRKS
jgi:D-glutamate cyclase